LPVQSTKLIEFTSLDQEAFRQVIEEAGLRSAACYMVKSENLVQLIESNKFDWPISVSLNLNYTLNSVEKPLGWQKKQCLGTSLDSWPKGTVFYFPEQYLSRELLFFAVEPKNRSKITEGSLDGVFEVLYRRISLIRQADGRRVDMTKEQVKEQVRQSNVDVSNLLNHEIRTPLSSIRGYSNLLGDPTVLGKNEPREFSELIEREIQNTLVAIEKLDCVFLGDRDSRLSNVLETIDISDFCQGLVNEHANHNANSQSILEFTFKSNLSSVRKIDCDRSRLKLAFGEVISNGINFSSQGILKVEITDSQDYVAIDFYDDGYGVAVGNEELIFLNFFRDHTSAPSMLTKRGSGVGLGVARNIASQHGGSLKFIRSSGRDGFFRFLIPIRKNDDLENQFSKGA